MESQVLADFTVVLSSWLRLAEVPEEKTVANRSWGELEMRSSFLTNCLFRVSFSPDP